MYCNTNQFPKLPFCGPHSKPHGARGLGKHYHLRFDPKLGMGKCKICRIPCACVAYTSMLDKPWISRMPSEKQERYKPVTKCTYWIVLGEFNNCNIIELSSNSTSSETFDEIHQVVLDGISDDMASLVESGKYRAINTTDTSTYKFYVIMFTSGAYTLQENTTIDGQILFCWRISCQCKISLFNTSRHQLVLESTIKTSCNQSDNTYNTSSTLGAGWENIRLRGLLVNLTKKRKKKKQDD